MAIRDNSRKPRHLSFTDLLGFSNDVMNPGFQAFITYVTFSPINASGIINGPLKLMTSINGNPLFQSKLRFIGFVFIFFLLFAFFLRTLSLLMFLYTSIRRVYFSLE